MEIKENEVYSVEEASKYLKVSESTMIRMIKQSLIGAAKIGKQYRIMGKEILRVISPQLEDQVGYIYNQGRRWIHDEPLLKKKTSAKKTKKVEVGE